MHEALRAFFEEQLEFRLEEGEPLEGSVFIGETEFLPVEVLRADEAAYQAEFSRWLDQEWLPQQEDRRNQILRLHANAKRYADLRDAVERRQVLPLVGSGMSVPSGLPTWSDLLRRIRTYTNLNPRALEELLDACAFEEAADLLASSMNAKLLSERIEHELRIEKTDAIGGAVRLLPALFPDMVMTTNLDDVLEHHYRRCGAGFNEVLPGLDIARYRSLKGPPNRFLLKLHGDCRRAQTYVLRTQEYEAAYGHGSVVREELALLYRTNNVVFLGASLGSDRAVRLLAEVATSDDGMPKHFALLALPESDEERVKRENFLSQRGIYPIWYDGGHDESLVALLVGLLSFDGATSAAP
jgi:hypothetical protein